MLLRRLVAGAALAAGIALSVSGCAGYTDDGSDYSGNEASPYDDVEVPEPDYDALIEEQDTLVEEQIAEAASQWKCSYAPSYDDDWHNDVACTNGVDVKVPYLREWDTFITEDEIMESAREYEDQLNAGR